MHDLLLMMQNICPKQLSFESDFLLLFVASRAWMFDVIQTSARRWMSQLRNSLIAFHNLAPYPNKAEMLLTRL